MNTQPIRICYQSYVDYENGKTVGWVVETKCEYFAPVAFPDVVSAGLKVQRLGTSSVTYEVGLFRNDSDAPRLAIRLIGQQSNSQAIGAKIYPSISSKDSSE